MSSLDPVAVAGAGIGGLAAALALGRSGASVHVYEKASDFSEAGAGIGLGPNAVRVLQQWGVNTALQAQACTPQGLIARRADDGRIAGQLPMGQSFIEKYGAPYLTVLRADLHRTLLDAVKKHEAITLHLNHGVSGINLHAKGLELEFDGIHQRHQAQALIGADGLHSNVRALMFDSDVPSASGHWAYRALLPMADAPKFFQQMHIGIWMGKRLHVVHYPVRGGDFLNLVVLIESNGPASQAGWDVSRSTEQITVDLKQAMHTSCHALNELIDAAKGWRAWCLFDRPPLWHAGQMAKDRVALLGDAAHPMLPYLAQGAGMAIEDAAALASFWQRTGKTASENLLDYANARWSRVSRVQQRSRRNGRIFHADGFLRMARDTALKWRGEQLMDLPWLYAA